MTARNSLVIWDDEAQRLAGVSNETNVWGAELKRLARLKAGPKHAHKIDDAYTRRNDTGNGVIFEWD